MENSSIITLHNKDNYTNFANKTANIRFFNYDKER